MRPAARFLLCSLVLALSAIEGPARADEPKGGGAPAPAAAAAPPAGVPFAGTVRRKGDRTPVPGVNVLVDDGDPSATTDEAGRFAIDAVPPGKHKVHVRGASVEPADTEETFTLGKRLEATYYVAAKDRYRSTVRGTRMVKETVEQTLAIEEIKHIPGTQGDPLKAVQNLPGVARAPFGAGQLIVWGSAPQDTRVYVDGVFIPTLYHFGGLRSTVNGEVVQSLTFLPGGYGADYGRGIGGVVEVETRRPRDDGYHGFVQLDTIDGSFLVEGPITKNLSFGVGARRSWIDIFLPLVTPNNFQLSPKYWDYQGRLRWRASPRDDVDLFLFGSDDSIQVVTQNPNPQLSAAFDSHIYYHRGLARWTHRFANGAVFTLTPSLGWDVPFQVQAQIGNVPFSVDARTFDYNLRAILRWPLASFARLDAGIDFEGNDYHITASTPSGPPQEGDQPPRSFGVGFTTTDSNLYYNDVAAYAGLVLSLFDKRVTLTPALRLDVYNFNGGLIGDASFHYTHALLEPRVSFRYDLNRWFSLKASLGSYHEPPNPTMLLPNYGNPALLPTDSTHFVVGFEVRPTSTLHVSVEGFYKVIGLRAVRGERPGDPLLDNDGIGRVYGAELLVRQELWHNFFGWISYTLLRSERKDHLDEDWHLFQFDQTHILTIIASYKLPRGYQVGLRFRYVTGSPSTPIASAFVDANSGLYQPIYGAPDSDRLGAFNQLDVRFDKTWTFRWWSLSLYLDIQNVYNAKNPEGYQYNFDFSKPQAVAGLPFFPALGIRGDF
jgi:hypothetical protein